MRTKKKVIKQVKTRSIDGRSYLVDADTLLLDVRVYGIAVRDGKVLVVPQFDGYDYPGGTVELGETHIEALKREFKEETGLSIKPLQPLNIYTSFFRHMFQKTDHQSLLVFYAVEVRGGEISEDGFTDKEKQYASLAQWVPIEELKKLRHECSLDIADELLDFAKSLDEKPQKKTRKRAAKKDGEKTAKEGKKKAAEKDEKKGEKVVKKGRKKAAKKSEEKAN